MSYSESPPSPHHDFSPLSSDLTSPSAGLSPNIGSEEFRFLDDVLAKRDFGFALLISSQLTSANDVGEMKGRY